MINLTRLTLATVLMGSLAMPGFAQQASSPTLTPVPAPAAPAAAAKHAPAMKTDGAGMKKSGMHKDTHATTPKAGSSGHAPDTAAKTGAAKTPAPATKAE